MSSVAPVPELAATSAGPFTVGDAWRTVRRYGVWPLARTAAALLLALAVSVELEAAYAGRIEADAHEQPQTGDGRPPPVVAGEAGQPW